MSTRTFPQATDCNVLLSSTGSAQDASVKSSITKEKSAAHLIESLRGSPYNSIYRPPQPH